MKREIITSVVCSIVLLFSTCKKEVGPAGPELSGTIMGFVTLYNSLGERIADAKGVLVRIDGTNPRTVLTDSIGEYQLDSIKTGIYNITFSKDSFNTFKRIGQQFVGGSDPVISNVTLYVPSINAVSNLTLTVVNNQVKVTGTMTHPGYDGYYRYFIGLNAAVSDTNYFSTGTLTVSGSALNTGINTDVYPAGSDIYVILYGLTNGDGGYVDVTNGNTYYPSLSTMGSNIATITVP